MFSKLREFFTIKKEKSMSIIDTDTKTTKQLKKQVSEQAKELGKLNGRLGAMRDELAIVTSEMNNFKTRVAEDMKRVVKAITETNKKNR
jgi:molecular chaperone GrpE (heat shock protein)